MIKKKADEPGKNPIEKRTLVAVGLILIGLFFVMSWKATPQEVIAPATPSPYVQDHLILGLYPVINKPSIQEDGKVRIMEFLSFYCGNCYRFNIIKHQLESKYGDALELRVLPIAWGDQSIKTVEAYILAERSGKGKEMADAIFRAIFEENKDISDVEVLTTLAMEVGLEDDFGEKLRSGDAGQEAQNNIRLAQQYLVEETPTLIINGNIVVNPRPTRGDVSLMAQNLEVIIQNLQG